MDSRAYFFYKNKEKLKNMRYHSCHSERWSSESRSVKQIIPLIHILVLSVFVTHSTLEIIGKWACPAFRSLMGAVVPSSSYCIPFSGIASIVLSSYLASSDIKNI